MSAHSSGFSILPQMGYAVKSFGQLGYGLTPGFDKSTHGRDKSAHGRDKSGPYRPSCHF
jgi:hypothetical protein